MSNDVSNANDTRSPTQVHRNTRIANPIDRHGVCMTYSQSKEENKIKHNDKEAMILWMVTNKFVNSYKHANNNAQALQKLSAQNKEEETVEIK